MTIIREVNILCPKHLVPLVHIPKPIADDAVVCPECGTGGTYKQVVEDGGNLVGGFLPAGQVQELVRQARLANK
jgi:hypothetical protein